MPRGEVREEFVSEGLGMPVAQFSINGLILGFPKIRGTILGVPIIRTISILGPILGSPHFGKLPYRATLLVPLNGGIWSLIVGI